MKASVLCGRWPNLVDDVDAVEDALSVQLIQNAVVAHMERACRQLGARKAPVR